MSQQYPPDQGQQSPYQQPSYPQLPSQPPFYPPVQQPPKKKSFIRSPLGIGCSVVAALVVLIIVIVAIASATSGGGSTANNPTPSGQSTTGATQQNTPAHTPKWTTVQKFTGSGIKKTSIFSAPDDWKILWSCDPNSFNGYQFNLIVTVTSSGNTPQDVAVNALCKKGSTSGETEEHQAGRVFLDINSEGSWKLQVQELK